MTSPSRCRGEMTSLRHSASSPRCQGEAVPSLSRFSFHGDTRALTVRSPLRSRSELTSPNLKGYRNNFVGFVDTVPSPSVQHYPTSHSRSFLSVDASDPEALSAQASIQCISGRPRYYI